MNIPINGKMRRLTSLHQEEPATKTRIPRSYASRAYTNMSIEQRYQALINWIVGNLHVCRKSRKLIQPMIDLLHDEIASQIRNE
jgi:hypothetical protein